MKGNSGRFGWRSRWTYLAAAALIFGWGAETAAGQKKKSSNQPEPPAQAQPAPSPPDEQQIDHNIGEMLAGFQLGDAEMMHKYYAENATFVRGTYDPPVTGWQNYAALYNQQRAGFQGIQLIRRNTFIFTHGDVAWACYQWEFSSRYNGQSFGAQGQTTLVFNKVGDNWLIVHNHTSALYPQAAQAQPATGQPPAQTPAPDSLKP